MPEYLIYFNQQWVGEHSEEWFEGRGPLAREVVEQMRAAGALVYAGGVDEDVDSALTFEPSEEGVAITPGLMAPRDAYIGGLTVISVKTEQEASDWAGKVAVACGWPQVLRRLV